MNAGFKTAGKFELMKHLGSGSFGEVYLGCNATGAPVAVKLEKKDDRHEQLLLEAKLYRLLKGCIGIPEVFTYGTDGAYNVLVMDLLGNSLETNFRQMGKKMSLKCSLMLIDQVIQRVETLHKHNFLHRDIKPDNFLMGSGSHAWQVYMIDLGLAKKYMSTTTHMHVPYREGKSLTGTARYASVGIHKGCEHSRRDDMYSIGYMMMYFLRGNLPWQGLQMDPKDCKEREDKYTKIKQKKMETSYEELCDGHPIECVQYFEYLDTLSFEAEPDYNFCRQLIADCMLRQNLEYDYIYDWTDAEEANYYDDSPMSPQGGTMGFSPRNGTSRNSPNSPMCSPRWGDQSSPKGNRRRR